jgi:peptidoglycan L-alanyl-D-glutamate endopeptidase CwlK
MGGDMTLFKLDSTGPRVAELQQQLREKGFDPGSEAGRYTAATEAAVRAFQQSEGLSADGVAGPNTIAALGLPAISSNVTLAMVTQLFPATPRTNIRLHLPYVLKGVLEGQLADRDMVLMSLATIRAETASFQPIDEGVSQFNTPPEGPPFSLYDSRADLGNRGAGDGEEFKGRGFVQLTGRANYGQVGNALGMGSRLLEDPDWANDPLIAARILAAFLKIHETEIRQALAANDLARARKLVNGGHHGLPEFEDAFRIGTDVLPAEVEIQAV